MARLKMLAAFVLMIAAGPSLASPVERWSPFIAEASARYAIPEAWIRRVMRAESGGRTTLRGRPIVSRAGAMGLMQLMPATWAAVRAAERLGSDPHEPRDNILAGTAYLRAMYDRFGYPGLFAAYNAGPSRYGAYLAKGRPLPRETVLYVQMVVGSGGSARAESEAPAIGGESRDPLFAIVRPSTRYRGPVSREPIFFRLERASVGKDDAARE